MKAITIHQPWATLIALGEKKFETRSWASRHRGPIAIHASKKDPLSTLRAMPHDVQSSILNCFYEKFGISSRAIDKMPTGVIVATANLSECGKVHIDVTGDAVLLRDDAPYYWIGRGSPEFNFGYYESGRYAWEMTDVCQLPVPIPAKGQQGLWNWEDKRI